MVDAVEETVVTLLTLGATVIGDDDVEMEGEVTTATGTIDDFVS